jgi:hypothetical protein
MLTVYVSPQNGGHVSFDGITYPRHVAIKTLPAGTNLVIEAIPIFGYRFNNWSGDVSSNKRIIHVKLNDTKRITANFSRIIPNWLIVTIGTAIVVPLLIRRRRGRLKNNTQVDPYDNGGL